MANLQTTMRPRRAPRVQYTHDDSDSEPFSDTAPRSSRPTRAARRVQTYRETSGDDSESFVDSFSGTLPSTHSVRKSQRQIGTKSRLCKPQKRRGGTTREQDSTSSFSLFKRQKRTPPYSTADHIINKSESPATTSSKVPPWQDLPYQVLLNIMTFASYPLHEQPLQIPPTINWLCSTSTLCRSFHEACIATLLHRPPLYSALRAHGLIALLRQGRKKPLTDYRSKIKFLDISVPILLIPKNGIDLDMLISNTPLLRGVRFYTDQDIAHAGPWSQASLGKPRSWAYPLQLFDRLDEQNILVRQFEWNGRFPTTRDALETAYQVHSRPSFSRLREISFLNLHFPDKTTEAENAEIRSLLTGALERLPELQKLTLNYCSVINIDVTSSIPPGLTYIEFAHCSQLTAEAIERYLLVGGQDLTTLKLFVSQFMSLNFLTKLKILCPRLEVLEIDQLHTSSSSFHDPDLSPHGLFPNDPPTWPETLVSLSVENLRQFDAADARKFLSSLVDSSTRLPYLKTLNVKTILKKANWRDRAALRKEWLSKLESVFLNTSEPTNWPPMGQTSHTGPPRVVSQRQSSRIADSNSKKSVGPDIPTEDSSDVAVVSSSRHARCDIVNLVISDQRPAQDQFNEGDFLDDEPSDDGEWTSDRSSEYMSRSYAW